MRQGRIYVALCVLAGLWVVVYWLWDASPGDGSAARVTFATTPSEGPADDLDIATDAADETTPAEAQLPDRGVIVPQFDTYVVQREGETWTTISIAVYATPDHADAIEDANPYVVSLEPGKQIRVPIDPANVRGEPVGSTSEQPETVEPRKAPEKTGPEIIAEHTVAPGEVLSVISKTYYGTSKHYMKIFEFNRKRLGLRDENSIREGQVLLIPKLKD